MRLIDADAILNDTIERYCKNCDRRKAIINGEWRIIYEIGDAPCRACSVDDLECEIEDAPTVDAVPVIRCKDCEYGRPHLVMQYADNTIAYKTFPWCGDMCYTTNGNGFCSEAERKEE